MNKDEFRFWVWLGIIVFLFYGDPDVWDKLHDAVMNMEFTNETKTNSFNPSSGF